MLSNPYGSNDGEILERVIRKIYNERVRDWFKDLDSIAALDLNIPRHAAYAACRHLDSDSLIQTVARQMLFAELVSRLAPPLPGETSRSPNVIRRGHPKVTLFFEEGSQDVEQGYAPITGQIGFRLMNEEANITEASMRTIATRIKAAFNTAPERIWRKGKIMASYSDWEKGYQLQLLTRNESDAKALIGKVLSIQSHTPDWENLNISENGNSSAAFPTLPPTELILGEVRRLPRRRPVAEVVFQHASLQVAGLPLPIILCDRVGRYANPLIEW